MLGDYIKLPTLVLTLFGILILIANAATIILQLDAIEQRRTAVSQRVELRKQNEMVICILQIKPEDRTQVTIDKCKEE